jgi:transposase
LNLTNQQWRLLEPLLLEPSPPAARGRPPLDPRPILDAILWKIRRSAPWTTIPACYPSHQSCFRRYQQWQRDGRLDQVFLTLYDDLLHRGRFDPQHALRGGAITITQDGDRCRILAAVDLMDTWELSTALVFIQLALTRLKQNLS